MRFDAYLARHLEGQSRSHAAMLIRDGAVRIADAVRKPGYKVKPGEHIVGRLPEPTPVDLAPQALPLDILFEDSDLIVINKPAGMVVHPAAGHATGTLVNALLYHCPDLGGIGGELRPGIVHRLDKDTTGVLVAAKNAQAHWALSHQFKERQIQKRYLALVVGSPSASSGRIDLPVGRHAVERKKMAVVNSGREALTLWQVQEQFTDMALLSLELKTGRTHQIRVHCQAIGHPLVGDPLYGRPKAMTRWAADHPSLAPVLKLVRRQMLHAAFIAFSHPASGKQLAFTAPLPEDMSSLIDHLRRNAT